MNARIEVGAYASLRKSIAQTMLQSAAMAARVGTDIDGLKAQAAHERNLIEADHWAKAPLRLADVDGALLAARWRRRFDRMPIDAASALRVAA